MAADLKKRPLQRVQGRDGLPKACSVEEWLDLHRKRDQSPRLGGIAWRNDQLVVVARIRGRVLALPFSRFTVDGRLRDLLNEKDRATYVDYHRRAMAGEFNAVMERKRWESGSGIGF